MSYIEKDGRLWLGCPGCGEPLFPAECRGRHDDDGNFVQHRDECRCRHCTWIWIDTARATCPCGTAARVDVDDGHAYAREVETCGATEGPNDG